MEAKLLEIASREDVPFPPPSPAVVADEGAAVRLTAAEFEAKLQEIEERKDIPPPPPPVERSPPTEEDEGEWDELREIEMREDDGELSSTDGEPSSADVTPPSTNATAPIDYDENWLAGRIASMRNEYELRGEELEELFRPDHLSRAKYQNTAPLSAYGAIFDVEGSLVDTTAVQGRAWGVVAEKAKKEAPTDLEIRQAIAQGGGEDAVGR